MSIVDAFNDYFDMIPATSEALKQEVYQLRYQVYCIEKGFENPAAYAENLEYDEYDAHSSHYLIRHRETGDYMATTRLILPVPHQLLPTEHYSQPHQLKRLQGMSHDNSAELSRCCVAKHFRRRKNERHLLVTNDVDELRFSRRAIGSAAHITLALLTCAIRMSNQNNVEYWYALLQPELKQVFSTLGVHFIDIGARVNYHGNSVPCAINVQTLLRTAAEKNTDYGLMLRT